MDSMVKIYISRALNEINAAEILFKVSNDDEFKKTFNIGTGKTFYSSVISHSYYAIFYVSKALLLTKDIKTSAPEVHSKTFNKFKETFVDTGILDVKLLMIYKKMITKADQLLQIFKDEKWKRGHFTYQTIPQTNKKPSEDSLKNAKLFIKNIKAVIESKDEK